ncbi:glycosyltransferase family 2 protein [Winogradskyella litorisediminis]|uniref:Glycosyltransferase family 2 protein n=1 Tax=Winogradskyella litorisediminis TaxID=1156618 RepID=A0ABW3NAW6_9FLAO
MAKRLTSSLIISTYNWPEALDLVLKSVLNQSEFPDEILIADDGSSEETKDLIESYVSKFDIPIIHVWQEDKGFQKSKILNQAIAKAKGEYLIQIDGDCIIHKHFVKDHLTEAETGYYLFGGRVNIQESFLPTLFKTKKINFSPFSKGIKKRPRAFYSPILAKFQGEVPEISEKFRGCNTSYFRKDAIAVNGYDEAFIGWGREDSEFMRRLHHNGIKGKRLKFKGILFHIFHVEKSRERLDANDDIELQTITSKSKWAENGIDKYLPKA